MPTTPRILWKNSTDYSIYTVDLRCQYFCLTCKESFFWFRYQSIKLLGGIPHFSSLDKSVQDYSALTVTFLLSFSHP